MKKKKILETNFDLHSISVLESILIVRLVPE